MSASVTPPRPLARRVMHLVRRLHLYFGLFLLPWAGLYGVTAFLFNHPFAFSDTPVTTFGRDAVRDTPMDKSPTPAAMAGEVVTELNRRAGSDGAYTLVEADRATFGREFAFATVKGEGRTVNVALDATGAGGTLRIKTDVPAEPKERAPFATGAGGGGRGRGNRGGGGGPRDGERPRTDDAVRLPNSLHERVATATPTVLERTGVPGGEVTVTSVPDVNFRMDDANGRRWKVTYNAQTGSVSGQPADTASEPLSTRRFLTRLHLAHGYPSAINARWWWAIIVDGMAFTMVFWAVSGLLMWWQIKATRKLGAVTLLLSVVAAAALGVTMWQLLAG